MDWNSLTRILKWVAIPFSRRSSQPRDWIWVSHIAGGFFTIWATDTVQKKPVVLEWVMHWIRVWRNKLCSLLYHPAAERPWTSHFTSLSPSFPTCKMDVTGSPRVIARIKCNIIHESPSVLDIPWIHEKIGRCWGWNILYSEHRKADPRLFQPAKIFKWAEKLIFIYTPMIWGENQGFNCSDPASRILI